MSVSLSLEATCYKMVDLLALLYVMFTCIFVTFLYGVLGQVWFLIASISDLLLFSYFVVSYKRKYVHEVLVNRLVNLAQLKVRFGELKYPT